MFPSCSYHHCRCRPRRRRRRSRPHCCHSSTESSLFVFNARFIPVLKLSCGLQQAHRILVYRLGCQRPQLCPCTCREHRLRACQLSVRMRTKEALVLLAPIDTISLRTLPLFGRLSRSLRVILLFACIRTICALRVSFLPHSNYEIIVE